MLWWVWAWSLPQSFGWSVGDHSALWRRASIEDDLAALRDIDGLSMLDLEGGDADAVRWLVRELASLVTGKLSLFREARELDGKFGLTPKGLADLRWSIVEDNVEKVTGGDSVVSLRAV